MKKILSFFVVFLASVFASYAQDESIVWEKDFKKAQALARAEGRPMLLDFTAEWCKPCKMMDAQFWVLPEVVQATKPFVAVKIDFDDKQDLVKKYGVGAIPFVVFTDPLGNLVTFRRGFSSKNAREINALFNEMPKDFSPVVKDYEAVELKKDDGEALLRIGDFYTKSKMFYLGAEYYRKALKTDEIKTDQEKSERLAAAVGMNYYGSRADAKAVEYLNDYLKDFPSGKRRETALAMVAISYANLGKEKDALKTLDILKREFPASSNISAINKAIEDAKNKKDKK